MENSDYGVMKHAEKSEVLEQDQIIVHSKMVNNL